VPGGGGEHGGASRRAQPAGCLAALDRWYGNSSPGETGGWSPQASLTSGLGRPPDLRADRKEESAVVSSRPPAATGVWTLGGSVLCIVLRGPPRGRLEASWSWH